ATRYITAAAISNGLYDVETDETRYQQQVWRVERHSESIGEAVARACADHIAHRDSCQRKHRHHSQQRKQRTAAMRDADTEVHVPWEEGRADQQHAGVVFVIGCPP